MMMVFILVFNVKAAKKFEKAISLIMITLTYAMHVNYSTFLTLNICKIDNMLSQLATYNQIPFIRFCKFFQFKIFLNIISHKRQAVVAKNKEVYF